MSSRLHPSLKGSKEFEHFPRAVTSLASQKTTRYIRLWPVHSDSAGNSAKHLMGQSGGIMKDTKYIISAYDAKRLCWTETQLSVYTSNSTEWMFLLIHMTAELLMALDVQYMDIFINWHFSMFGQQRCVDKSNRAFNICADVLHVYVCLEHLSSATRAKETRTNDTSRPINHILTQH